MSRLLEMVLMILSQQCAARKNTYILIVVLKLLSLYGQEKQLRMAFQMFKNLNNYQTQIGKHNELRETLFELE